MNNMIELVRPNSLRESHFLKDIYEVVKKTDEENWSCFEAEKEKEFALEFLKYGELTRLIYKDKQPVAYLSCYLLKPNAHVFLQDDYYKTIGMSLSDLRDEYVGTNRSYQKNILYINVVAVIKEFQGSVKVLKAISEALLDIIKHDLFYTTSYSVDKRLYPKKIYAVAITNNGVRMCDFFDLELVSNSKRLVGTTETERKLYKGDMHSLFNKLFKIYKK